MKKITLFLLLGVLSASLSMCSGDKDKKSEETASAPAVEAPVKTAVSWIADYTKEGKLLMKPGEPIPADSLNTNYILNFLNSTYPEIRMEPVSQNHDTLLVKIPNSRYLTQQIGSSGAQTYLAEATYNLTEIPGITHVTILFKAGDHASPDTYSRSDFPNK